jgi:mannose-1-phosphate guanylyltransferase
MSNETDFRPVILAGGSGTRFWPRSRRAHAKQVLALDGERSMIQQTVERLKPLASLEKTWIITNEFLAHEIADQLPGLPGAQIVQEPVARNTAPACGLAAFLIERDNPAAVLGVFPSDHVIADEPRFLKALQIDPRNYEAEFNLGLSLLHQNRRDEARTHFQAALRIQPDYPAARQALSELDRPAK